MDGNETMVIAYLSPNAAVRRTCAAAQQNQLRARSVSEREAASGEGGRYCES
jgi:hypothetical protein